METDDRPVPVEDEKQTGLTLANAALPRAPR
jgi:hypothetical protein